MQIFTNADKAHAAKVLGRLGLEDCFEGIICFETLNPPPEPADNLDALDDDSLFAGGKQDQDHTTDSVENSSLSYNSKILCKPSVEAFEAAVRIANVDPKKTVRPSLSFCLFLQKLLEIR